MSRHRNELDQGPSQDATANVASGSLDRRRFLDFSLRGLGATALWQLLGSDTARGASPDESSTFLHGRIRARRAVQISLVGGLSHLDSFDPKPQLVRCHGQTLDTDEKPDLFFGQMGRLRQSDFAFRPRGRSGLEISDLFPCLAQHADLLTVVRSMTSDSANHTPALFLANSGFPMNGFPSMGSWLSFGLGSQSDDLPVYVVLPDERGAPNGGASNWSSAFLPAQHQGVRFSSGPQPVRDLFPAEAIAPDAEEAMRRFLERRDRAHDESVGGDPALRARLRSYELAARMQLSVPEATELGTEPASVREHYGLDDPRTAGTARRCLLARRLLERGVRFVQIYSGGPIAGEPRSSWDAHEDVRQNHSVEAERIDRPVAALLADLHQRGMLEDTLFLITTEFGRTPFTQSASDVVGTGRDHNRTGFSVALAGAGLRPGIAHGATDELGWKSVLSPTTWHDLHATILHLFGIDHTRLTYYHGGIARRLTSVHGEVREEILA